MSYRCDFNKYTIRSLINTSTARNSKNSLEHTSDIRQSLEELDDESDEDMLLIKSAAEINEEFAENEQFDETDSSEEEEK